MDRSDYHVEYYKNNKERYQAYRAKNIDNIREHQKQYKRNLAPKRKCDTFIARYHKYDDDTKTLIKIELEKILQNLA